jgi:hypothetical protein
LFQGNENLLEDCDASIKSDPDYMASYEKWLKETSKEDQKEITRKQREEFKAEVEARKNTQIA